MTGIRDRIGVKKRILKNHVESVTSGKKTDSSLDQIGSKIAATRNQTSISDCLDETDDKMHEGKKMHVRREAGEEEREGKKEEKKGEGKKEEKKGEEEREEKKGEEEREKEKRREKNHEIL